MAPCKDSYPRDDMRALPSYQHHRQLSSHILVKEHLRLKFASIPMRLVAADAGFLPPGPLTLLADIVLRLDLTANVTKT